MPSTKNSCINTKRREYIFFIDKCEVVTIGKLLFTIEITSFTDIDATCYNRKKVITIVKTLKMSIPNTIEKTLFTIEKMLFIRDNRDIVIYNRNSVYFSRSFFTFEKTSFTIVKIIIWYS